MRGLIVVALTCSLTALSHARQPEDDSLAGAAADEAEESEPAESEEPIDVVVEGVKQPPSVTSLRRAEVRQVPGAFGDPFRAIEIMPGVTPIVSGLPFFYVRGAPPGNVGYFLDGVQVPYLFHAAAGPSVIHPAIVQRVDLYAGGYPARYGRYAGAIVSAETTEPRLDWHGEARVRLVDAGAFVEGGFAEGRGTATLAGRYSYTAGLFSLISPEIALSYWDYQARIGYDITDRDRLSVFAFGAFDYLSETRNSVENVLFGAEFYRIDTRYDVRFDDGGTMRTAVTWGFDRTRLDDGVSTQDVLGRARIELKRPLTDQVTLRGGFDVRLDDYTSRGLEKSEPDTSREAFNTLFPGRADTASGAWIDVVWRPQSGIEITPGIRFDAFQSNGASAAAADPRLAFVATIHPRVRILHALGVAHQPPSFIVPVPGLAVADLQGGLQRSVQASSGVEVALPWSTKVTVTVFNGVLLNMTDAIGVPESGEDGPGIPRSLGGAKGVEVYIRRSLAKRLGGFIAYTFSRSTRSTGRSRFLSAFDRTHVLHAAFGFNLGRGWRAGTRFSIYSGSPNLSSTELVESFLSGGEPSRDPAFYRFDFRFEKKWVISDSLWISVVLEMMNATLNKETIKGNEVGPVTIPSIGVEAGF